MSFFSVSDAWDVSVTLDERAACTSAAKVLERHASLVARDLIMPPVNPIPSRNSKIQAMQRLAIQKGKRIVFDFFIKVTYCAILFF